MIIDFYILTYELITLVLRKDELLVQMFWCFIEPIQLVHDEHQNYNQEFRDKAIVSSQVMVFEDYLRRFFGTDNIHLLDGNDFAHPVVYNVAELQPNLIVCNFEEYGINPIVYHLEEDNSVDCIIQVPAYLETKESQLWAILNEYMFADKIIKIEYV